jgi:hypothetical protein
VGAQVEGTACRVRCNGRVPLVTFNYDMMIERALRDREIAVTDTDSYVNNTPTDAHGL